MKEHRSKTRASRPALALGILLVAAFVVATPHTKANAAPCSGRYTVADGTVTDNDTNLTWEKNATYGEVPWKADFFLDPSAVRHCQEINDFALGGFTDWRLPTVLELQTLVDDSIDNQGGAVPSLDPTAFDDPDQNGIYWSSTPHLDPSSLQWFTVDFGLSRPGGYVLYQSEDSPNRVRCVR